MKYVYILLVGSILYCLITYLDVKPMLSQKSEYSFTCEYTFYCGLVFCGFTNFAYLFFNFGYVNMQFRCLKV